MEPLEKATLHLSASSYPTSGDVQFIFESIKSHLKYYAEKDEFTQKEVAKLIYKKMEEYLPLMDQALSISTTLDSCTKLASLSTSNAIHARQHLQCVFNIYQEKNSVSNGDERNVNTNNSSYNTRHYFNQLRHQSSNSTSSITPTLSFSTNTELDRYFALPVDEDTEPLKW